MATSIAEMGIMSDDKGSYDMSCFAVAHASLSNCSRLSGGHNMIDNIAKVVWRRLVGKMWHGYATSTVWLHDALSLATVVHLLFCLLPSAFDLIPRPQSMLMSLLLRASTENGKSAI